MGARDIGRKATVFTEGVHVLKAEWYYRPVFMRCPRTLVLSGSSRRYYWQDKFERSKQAIQLECFKDQAPKRLLGIIK